jgi:hypothetical protein
MPSIHIKRLKALVKSSPFAESLVWRARRLFPNALVFGMTSKEEQRYFRHYAQTQFTGAGEMVDLGCWLGSTTIPLAKGLVSNPKGSGRHIHAYDLFTWQKWMDPFLPGCSRKYRVGESFLDEFHIRTRAYVDRIKVYPGDLQRIGWSGRPIEFLLVDAMKSWDLAASVVEHFFPKLTPEIGVLVHQDFKHYYTSWVHLIQYRLRDYFSFEYDAPDSGSAAFRLRRPLDLDLGWVRNLKSFSDQEIDAAFAWSLSLVGEQSTPNIAAAKVMHFIHLGRLADARRTLEDFSRQRIAMDSDLSVCAQVLAAREKRAEDRVVS